MFDSELLAILTLAVIVLGTMAVLFFHRVIKPRVEESLFWQKYHTVFRALDEVVTNTVLRIAFAHEDLSAFEDTAKRTGRDVRLVAAMWLVNEFTNAHGIEIDEETIVSSIEGKVALLKKAGLLPSSQVAVNIVPPFVEEYAPPTPEVVEQAQTLFTRHYVQTPNIYD